MKLMFLGDIVGKAGRDVVVAEVPRLRDQLGLDFVVANGENAAHGFGISPKICEDLFDAGVDVVTGGNHSWDRPEILSYIDEEPRLLRPANFPAGTPGKGVSLFDSRDGKHRVLVINVMCRLFMELLDNPFDALEKALPEGDPAAAGFDCVLVDMHGEATSEKYGIGHFCDGRASLVVGTHTHVPTGDAHILEHGTGYQTDAGMCGDYDSVIGMQKEGSLDRFLNRLPKPRMQPAEGEATLCGTVIETDPKTGLAKRVQPIRIGGKLSPTWPG
ncbi:TIGR00282 family metallophosphoesterase [Hwanghaeella sp. LZ110]|jgi:2',3'-cyclic-nucleotide 2'-phosphodiesterase|uniref:TIGR00282 family metallophosphoesterase n=1 Tax=Hwanghaeella sp. LZ110 TaxID=3402810 RepID=UPI003B6825C4